MYICMCINKFNKPKCLRETGNEMQVNLPKNIALYNTMKQLFIHFSDYLSPFPVTLSVFSYAKQHNLIK